jgi:uncharacterized phage protein (TIGR02220 family)
MLTTKKIQYTVSINQPLTLEHGLTLSRACVFDYLVKGIAWATDIMEVDGKTFFYLSRVKAKNDLPMITDKADTMYRHYKGLENAGLIEYHLEPVTDSNGAILFMKDYIRIPSQIVEKYYQKTIATPSEIDNDPPTENENDPPCNENPTNYNINIDTKSINKDTKENNVDASADHRRKKVFVDQLAIKHLNEVAGRAFKFEGKAGAANRRKVKLILEKGYTLEEIKKMIDFKAAEWGSSTYWRRYLRPDTLFGSKAGTYIEESKTLKPIKAQNNGKFKHAKQSKENALRRSEKEYSESGGLFRPNRGA